MIGRECKEICEVMSIPTDPVRTHLPMGLGLADEISVSKMKKQVELTLM